MTVMGYTLDNLSMMALVLSIGFVVDDAIVMLENIVRHSEMGESAARGRIQRIAGNRVHDSVDDAVAGGGIHSRSVHGRHSGPVVPGVCGHDHRRHSDFRSRVVDADADAVQPLPEVRQSTSEAGPAVHAQPSAFSTGCWISTITACSGFCGIGRERWRSAS